MSMVERNERCGMRTYTVMEYEQEDFDLIKENMTAEKAASILERLPRGWFSYTMPNWGKAKDYDVENYEICCAIWFAIDVLKGGAK